MGICCMFFKINAFPPLCARICVGHRIVPSYYGCWWSIPGMPPRVSPSVKSSETRKMNSLIPWSLTRPWKPGKVGRSWWRHAMKTLSGPLWGESIGHCWLPWKILVWRGAKLHNCPLLSHLLLDKMASVSQTIFSDAFSWMKIFVFWLKYHWSVFLSVQLTITQHWFR